MNVLVGFTLTGADGTYVLDAIPDGTDITVGFVPPFVGPDGPCSTSDGPPPAPGPGELQPVWFDDVFLDLTAPELGMDPFAFAVSAGATTVQAGATGVDACLTTAPASQVPRPSCDPVPTPVATPAAAVVAQPTLTG